MHLYNLWYEPPDLKFDPFAVVFSIDILLSLSKDTKANIFTETTMSIGNKMANGSSFSLPLSKSHCKLSTKTILYSLWQTKMIWIRLTDWGIKHISKQSIWKKCQGDSGNLMCLISASIMSWVRVWVELIVY